MDLTPEERNRRLDAILPELEKMVETEKRMTWLWSSLRVWAGYVLGALAFIVAAKSYIIQLFLSNGGPKP